MRALNNIIVTLTIVSCSFFLTACGEDLPLLASLPEDATILAFGDSLTYGTGAKEHESYPAILAKLSRHTIINAGVPGEESAAGLKRLPALLEAHQPKLLILCHGGNDLLRQKSMAAMESNIRAMIQLATDQNIPVVLLGVPRPGLFLSSFEAYQKIADSMDVIFIEDLIADILGDNGLKADAVHPNKDGYKMMAETIYATLEKKGLW